ncbi:MAG: SRPBCC family protein [Candidatus Methylopumilus sp.]|jgi:uncharacterized protein YndB with AHSA1/START domain
MLKTILITLAAVLIVFFIYAAFRADTFHIQRSANIQAPAEKLYAIIDDHHQWSNWSPWEKLDPAMKKTFSGAGNGKGAIFEWEGNKEVGSGRNEIIESIPATKIIMQLDMFTPFEAHNIVEFTLTPQGDTTNITWAMHGPQPYMAKVMSVFFDCDKMVGGMFEDGLANLKRFAEK